MSDSVGSYWNRSLSVASGGTSTTEIDIGDSTLIGFEVQTTAGSSLTALTIRVSSTQGGEKRALQTSTGGAVTLSFSYDAGIGMSASAAQALAPWRYFDLLTTAATTAAITILVNAK